jgi:hypothetical protein
MTVIGILIALLVFALIVWIISLIPLPATGFPLRNILFAIAAILFILYLVGYVR